MSPSTSETAPHVLLDDTVPPLAASIAMGFLFGTLIIVGVAGNVLVCLAIYANRKLRKKENMYFVSLAVADLLLCILIMPFAAYNDIAGRWPFGDYCKIWMSLDIMCCTASILHLCAISFDRCYHIHFPMQYGQHMTGRRIFSAILLVWTLSALIAFVPLSFETHFDRALSRVYFFDHSFSQGLQPASNFSVLTDGSRVQSDDEGHSLITDGIAKDSDQSSSPMTTSTDQGFTFYYRCSFHLEPTYAIFSSCLSFYIPSCVMIAAYTKLYKYARRHVRTIRHQLETATTLLMNVASTNAANNSNNNNVTNKGAMEKSTSNSALSRKRDCGASDSKARVTLGVIFGLFIVSWGPFFVCNIVRAFCTHCVPHALFLTLTWMGYSNSVHNPFVYTVFNRDFRQAFEKILMCGKDKPKRPSIVAINFDHRHPRNGSMVFANGRNTNRDNMVDASRSSRRNTVDRRSIREGNQ